jgi:hypothetical protein
MFERPTIFYYKNNCLLWILDTCEVFYIIIPFEIKTSKNVGRSFNHTDSDDEERFHPKLQQTRFV